jgi:hypothetical protein
MAGTSVNQPTFGKGIVVSFAVALVVAALAGFAIGEGDGGTPMTQTTNALFWVVAVLAVIVAGVGAQYAERTAALAAAAVGHPHRQAALATAWAVPAVATLGAVLLVATYHNLAMLFLGPLIAFLGIAGSLLSRDLLDDAGESAHRLATTVHTLVIHAVAFLTLGAIYLNKLPDWFGATLAGLVAGALVLETLERGELPPSRRVLYALMGALVLWQATLAVNWWPTYGWTGGAALLVCFYLVAGVLLARAQRTAVRSRDLLEYGLVGAVALLILSLTA